MIFKFKHHNVFIVEQEKIALNSSHDKRYLTPNSSKLISTVENMEIDN